jgi:hypothetical protein
MEEVRFGVNRKTIQNGNEGGAKQMEVSKRVVLAVMSVGFFAYGDGGYVPASDINNQQLTLKPTKEG